MRKTLTVAGGFALAVALGACGQTADGAHADTGSLVRAASASTTEHQSATMTMTMNMGPVTANAEGAQTFEGTDSQATMTVSMDMSAAGQGSLDMEMRMLDGVVYVKVPEDLPGANVEPGKPWIQMDVAEMGDLSGMDMEQMLEQGDPTQMLDMLSDAGKITGSENTEVDGTEAVKYSLDVDFEKLIEQFGSGMDEVPGISNLDIDDVPMEIWIDDKDLPVRTTVDFGDVLEKAIEEAGGEVPSDMNLDESEITVSYSDWGTEVDVEAPPESQVGEGSLPGMP